MDDFRDEDELDEEAPEVVGPSPLEDEDDPFADDKDEEDELLKDSFQVEEEGEGETL